MKNTLRRLLGLIAPLTLAACETPTPMSPDFGRSVAHNMALQIVDPAPAYAEPATMDGARAASAVLRYQAGQVKELEKLSTSSIKSEK